ncbi:unnamed protein product [Closterium sp. NIES-65]|nr:unnamed protein product [Closterium sp. NIES-65]
MESRYFARLSDAWRTEFGDDAELPDWVELLRQEVDIFALDYDAILTAMYALSTSAEGDCHLCVPPDPGIQSTALGAGASPAPGASEAAALGGRASPAPGVGEAAALGASESPTLGAGESALSGAARAAVLHTLTFDSGASRSFFRDRTTLTPLSRPVAVSLADPSGGPVLVHYSIVLPCPAAPCGSLSGLYLPSFSTNLVSGADLQDGGVDQLSSGTTALVTPPCLISEAWPPVSLSLVSPGPSLPFLRACPYLRSLRQGAAAHPSSLLGVSSDRGSAADSHNGRVGPSPRPWTGGGEFSSELLRAFCRAEGICQTFMLPASPQQNGIAEHRIGMVMDVACTSMIHAVAPHFLWPFAVQYAAHQIILHPRVSMPETSPTLRWTGKVGDASAFRVWVSRAFVRELSANKLSSRAVPCIFLGSPLDAPGWQFYHPTSRRVLSSQDVTFDESVPYYRLFPYRAAPLPPPAALPRARSPPGRPPPPSGSCPLSLSVRSLGVLGLGVLSLGVLRLGVLSLGLMSLGCFVPAGATFSPGAAQVVCWRWSRAAAAGGAAGAGGSAAAGGPTTAGGSGATGPGGARTGGTGAAGPGRAPRAGAAGGAGAGGAAGVGAAGGTTRAGAAVSSGGPAGAGAAGGAGAGGADGAGALVCAGVGATGEAGGAARAGGAAGVGANAGGAGAVPAGSGGAPRLRPYFVPLLEQVLGLPPSTGPAHSLECPPPVQSESQLQLASPMPAASPYTGPTGGLAEHRKPESRPASPLRAARTGRRVLCQRPPAVLGTHQMALRPSTTPQRVPLPSPPESSLPALADPESDSLHAASPTVTRLLATVVTDPSFESTAASTLVAELVDFAAHCRIDNTVSLVAESESVSPSSVGGECALSTDVLEDRQEEFQYFAAALPHIVSMLLALEGDPDAPGIPTPRSYVEAIQGPYSSQW